MKKTLLASVIGCALTPAPGQALRDDELLEPATDAALAKAVDALPNPAPRLTAAYIQAQILDETYTRIEGTCVTVCTLTLVNGHRVVGVNEGPVSEANFDQTLGCEYAYKKAVDQVWQLEGYLLRDRLYQMGRVEVQS